MSRSQYSRLFRSVLGERRYDGRVIRVDSSLIVSERCLVKCVVYVQVKQDSAQVQPETLQRACYNEMTWLSAEMFETSVTGDTTGCLPGRLES